MTREEILAVALAITSYYIKLTFDEPNSEDSKRIAKAMSKHTGISDLEIHRFHNAIINGNVLNSFKDTRVYELSWILLKYHLSSTGKLPNSRFRGRLSNLANDEDLSLNQVLETIRTAYKEIIDESLSPQKKP